jgi:hypothetical protein
MVFDVSPSFRTEDIIKTQDGLHRPRARAAVLVRVCCWWVHVKGLFTCAVGGSMSRACSRVLIQSPCPRACPHQHPRYGSRPCQHQRLHQCLRLRHCDEYRLTAVWPLTKQQWPWRDRKDMFVQLIESFLLSRCRAVRCNTTVVSVHLPRLGQG